jgi:hypothetical protein
MIETNEIEELRRSFRPTRITTLFVGESAPKNDKFFYNMNTGLYRAMKVAFDGNDDFLSTFKARGMYLDDLSLIPVNDMERNERKRQCQSSIGDLADRLKAYQPTEIVVIGLGIEKFIRKAAETAKLNVPIFATPFPNWLKDKQQFEVDMALIARRLSGTKKTKGIVQ